MSVDGEFKRLTAKDRLCAAVLKAVRENDTAALRRLGLGGFAQYAGRLSELMTASVRGGLDYSPDFAALMRQVNSPVRYAHHLVNEAGAAVQTALDERNGLRLRVVQPDYNDGRTKAIVGEAAESDSEHAADNLATQLGTEIKDAGNEFMRQNAEQRSRAGFKVTVERTGGTNCCPWCSDRIGRWELKDAPKDVFGVHDKCTCMITYTDGRGVSTQANAAAGKWLWHPIEQNTPPLHVLTGGEKRGAGEPKRLTGGANGGIIKALTIDNFNEADPKGSISKECVETIIKTLKSQKQLYSYDGVKLIDLPPDENNRYEIIRTNVIATARYPRVVLELNNQFFAGRSKEEIDEIIKLQKYSAANSLEEAIIHECGHLKVIGDRTYEEYEAIDKELKGKAFTAPIEGREDHKSLQDLAAGISKYAQKDGLECIAESEIILFRGKSLDEELKKLYDKYAK